MSGGKGGSQTSKVEIPKWMEDAAKRNIAQGERTAQIGYMPYYGPDVAAFSPMQEASFQNTADMASAFGMSAPSSGMEGMPQAQTFAGGMQGYSSAPMFEQSVDALRENRPGQYDMYARSGPLYDPYSDSGSTVFDGSMGRTSQQSTYHPESGYATQGPLGGLYNQYQNPLNISPAVRAPISYGDAFSVQPNVGNTPSNLGFSR